MSTNWVAFFDALESRSPLYREQADLYVESLDAAVGLRRDQRVLDFGCGFGYVAARLSPLVAEVLVWDASSNMRSVAERSTASLSNVHPCHLSTLDASVWEGPDLDLILVNSVAQYMAPDELTDWLARWRSMLAPTGGIVLSDLISADHRSASDMADLVRLGAHHRSPVRAVREALGGIREYRRTSRAVPLVRIDPDDLRRRARRAGLQTTVLGGNLTHFRKRWAAVLRPNKV